MMAKLTAREAAILRMSMEDESRDLKQGAQNTSEDYMSEYPRILYRQTKDAELAIISTHPDGRPRETFKINEFHGLLCETTIVEDGDEAERLSAEGWEISPAAAHGLKPGLAAKTTAKDDEIAALRAQIAAMEAAKNEPVPDSERRGPGRPRKQEDAVGPQ